MKTIFAQPFSVENMNEEDLDSVGIELMILDKFYYFVISFHTKCNI